MADDVSEIALEDSIGLKGYFHAAHCVIWAPWDHRIFGKYEARAAILMQARFDGAKGFIGGGVGKETDGLINCREEIVDGLNKELVEEANLDTAKHVVKAENHLISHVQHANKFVSHLYAMKVDMAELQEIEKRVLDAVDYGDEVFGTVRVPLYTTEDGKGGLPTFLKNVFAGNCSKQLLFALKTLRILSDEEIEAAVEISKATSSCRKTESSTTPSKRKNYDLKFKLEVVAYAEKHNMSKASKDKKVSRSCVKDWSKQKAQLEAQLNAIPPSCGTLSKRLQGGGRPLRDKDLDEKLIGWVRRQRRRKVRVSRTMIQKQALAFSTDERFNASNGWLERFLARHDLVSRRVTASCRQEPEVVEYMLLVDQSRHASDYREEEENDGYGYDSDMSVDLPLEITIS